MVLDSNITICEGASSNPCSSWQMSPCLRGGLMTRVEFQTREVSIDAHGSAVTLQRELGDKVESREQRLQSA